MLDENTKTPNPSITMADEENKDVADAVEVVEVVQEKKVPPPVVLRKGTVSMAKRIDPNSRISKLGMSIKLPGMRPSPGTGVDAPVPALDGRGGGAGDVVYEEPWEDREKRLAGEKKQTPQEKLAKMLQASQMSRGIMIDQKQLGLAMVMGGKKLVPAVPLNAPYSEHLPSQNKPAHVLTDPDADTKANAVAETKPTIVAPKDKSGFKIAGCGPGGIGEMSEHLNEDTVQWGLLRFSIGSGTFQRNKMLLIHFNGVNCSGLSKAKKNRSAQKAEDTLSPFNTKLVLTEKEEVNLDNVLELTKKVFAGDNLKDFSIADMKSDYEHMIADTRKKNIEAMLKGDDETTKRQTAKEMGVSAEDALKLVRKPMGAFNWALFRPDAADFTLYDAGSLSVSEMVENLPEDECLCGLVRMGFGAGKWRRTKYISIWWAGEKVGAHKKGSMLGHNKDRTMHRLNPSIGPMEAHARDDLSLEAIIDKVKRASVIDGDGVDGIGGVQGDAGDPFSMDAYYAALEEEVKSQDNKEFFGEKVAQTQSLGVQHTITEVGKKAGIYTWCLVEVDM
eukprot:m.57363 g.57363  ORF g.57363 m.57363 type:complete len:560 (-) comp22376_c0_seq1:334-2013(-)